MNRQSLVEFSNDYFSSCELNHIAKEKALLEELISVQIFEPPIIAISTANNPEFEYLKKDDGIGNHFMLPAQWLPEAKSVISYFFPFTETIAIAIKKIKIIPPKDGSTEGLKAKLLSIIFPVLLLISLLKMALKRFPLQLTNDFL